MFLYNEYPVEQLKPLNWHIETILFQLQTAMHYVITIPIIKQLSDFSSAFDGLWHFR